MIKILFADDDLKYSMLLKSFLQQHGYDVTYAGNGKKAWEQFPEVKPCLLYTSPSPRDSTSSRMPSSA